MNVPAIKIFDSAYGRAERFLMRSEGTKSELFINKPETKDDLRAAVVFTVAAIDAYFKVKIVEYVKYEHSKGSPKFKLSPYAEKLVKDQMSKELFGREFKDIKERRQREAILTYLDSKKPTVIGYLEDAVCDTVFQSLEKIDDAFRIMGQTPEKIWNKVDSAVKAYVKRDETRGRFVEVRVQLKTMFERRNQIVHAADISLTSLKSGGKERQIGYEYVFPLVTYSGIFIKEIDKLIK